MKLFVEKQGKFSVLAKEMEKEIGSYLKISQLKKLRVIQGYQIEGLEKAQLERIKEEIFSGNNDKLTESLQLDGGDFSFSFRSLESQYDQKAESLESLITLLYPKTEAKVISFVTVVGYGTLKDFEISTIKAYYINPLESREINPEDQLISDFSGEIDPVITLDGFIEQDEKALEQTKEDYGISMNMEDFLFCQEYYKKEGKNPTITELKILDTYWSDHCRHSTFLTLLEKVQLEENKYTKGLSQAMKRFEERTAEIYPSQRPTCLMDIATIEAKSLKKRGILTNLEESEEINACSIDVVGEVDGKPENFVIMFKNETHNHPTEMEPFGGAGTCIGGGIRDPLSGRSFVYGAMRITGAADPREAYADTLEGKLPQRKITKVAADGYSAYANEIGLASGYLQEFYDPGFKAKRMECGALVSYNYKENITRGGAAAGDVIILLGGKTGRDGIGGATGSSKQQGEISLKHSAEVQKGNPIIERNIIRLFRKPEISKLIKKCNDFGAGGVSVAIGELATSLHINLDKVPVKYSGLNGTEVAISESQERMAILVDKKDEAQFIKAAEAENLSAVTVAKVTDSDRIIMEFQGETICDLASEFLNSGGVRQKTNVLVKAPSFSLEKATSKDLEKEWLKNLSDINIASKQGIANQFDKSVGGQSSFSPFGGKTQNTAEQGLAMKLPLEKGSTNLGTIMTLGYDPSLGYQSPFHAALYAVVESVMKVVSMGGKLEKIHLSFQEYFESMKSPESWGKVYAAVMGAFLVQDQLELAAIGGKDSMSGSYKDIDVPPSLLSFAVAPCDTSKLVSRAFKAADNNVYLIKTAILEDGTPNFDQLKTNIKALTELIAAGKVKSASLVGKGGIAAAVSQMCFGNELGFKFAEVPKNLFDDSYTDVIIETEEDLAFELLGKITKEREIKLGEVTIDLAKALKSWQQPLEEVFATDFEAETKKIEPKAVEIAPKKPVEKSIPRIVIPVFPGTTGEYTLKRQFQKAGGEVSEVLFATRDIENSFGELKAAIKAAEILAIPSGMSAGAQPEAAKLIFMILKDEKIKTEINNLIDRGGLILGFGEGFKALMDSGLIENGKVADKTDTLSAEKNLSNSFYSGLIETKAINSVYPWNQNNAELLPVAVLEGRVELSQQDFEKYYSNGQILRAYMQGNQLGSEYGIEAMVSPNGQVFGCMSDPSQLEEGLYSNVFEAGTHSMFKNIIDFFKN